jgi:hypothetical protein
MVVLSSDSDFIKYAMKCYDNPSVSVEAFQEDLNRIELLNKQFAKYTNSGQLNERLALNHVVILFNVFGAGAVDLIFFKIKDEFLSIIKTFLVFLDYMPEKYIEVPINMDIATRLRAL